MLKRVTAFLMCLLMVLSGLPVSPLAQWLDFSLTASAAETAYVEITPESLVVYENRTQELEAAFYDENGSIVTEGVSYSWESGNTSVATVDSEGVVKGVSSSVSNGLVSVTVTAVYEGTEYTDSCAVQVKEFRAVTGLDKVTEEAVVCTAGDTLELKVSVYPTTASVKALEWTSSDTELLEIYQSGVDEDTSRAYARIKAKNGQGGTVRVTYTTTDQTEKSGYFTVKILPQIKTLSVSPHLVLTLNSPKTRIAYAVTPSTAGNQVLSWVSGNTSICTVDNPSGYVTPRSVGICQVSATTTDGTGITRYTKVIVSDGATSITLNKEKLTLDRGETFNLDATCKTPTITSGYVDAVSWTSSNEGVATVDALGNVKAVSAGTTVITAKTMDSTALTAQCVVNVTQAVTDVSLPENAVCWLNGKITLTPVITPSDATDKAVTWTSSDESVATVSSEGLITGKKVGTADITVKTNDGSYEATCRVSVEIAPTSVSLSKSSVTLKKGSSTNGSITLTATVLPSNATNKSVQWLSSDTSVATVSSTGKVTAVAGGTATISCKTVRANKYASCTVTVTEDETSVQITNIPDTYFYVGRSHTLSAKVLPSTATNKSVTWSSSDTSVLTVSSSGVITGKSEGKAVVTVKTKNKGLTASVTITVNPKISVSGISLSKSSYSLLRGKTFMLVATVLPDNASEKGLKWSSNNTAVASVASNGTVTAKSAGTAVISATTIDGNYTKSCVVTVIEPVSGVSLNKSKLTLYKGNSGTLTATVAPADASDKSVKWTSSNTSVAKVKSNGVVTAVGKGTAVITVTTNDGEYTAQCKVTVKIPVSSVKINSSLVKIPKGETRVVTTTISPSNASNQNVTWSSSDESIATVSAAGMIKGIRTGTATITVKTEDGDKKATVNVRVFQEVTSVKLAYSSISLDAGKKKTLEATVRPLTATDKTVTWKSSNKKVAKVSSKGVITAVAAGTATITCSSKDGYSSTTCKITVTQPATGIKFSAKSETVRIGSPEKLSVTVLPTSASNKSVTWKSSNKKIAKVSDSGVVTGVKKGTAKITATTANGKFSATITVKVKQPVKSVSLNKTSITIGIGKTTIITETVKPSSASNKAVSWSSSDNDVLTVSSEGKITAKSPGYAIVTCTTKDGKKKATCSVFVNQPLKSIKLKKTKLTVDINDNPKLKVEFKPSDASNKAVKWTSSNKKVVKVTSSGVLKPVSTGKATITVTSVEGGYKATCEVTVVKKVKSVSLPETLTVYLGKKTTLEAALKPVKPTNAKVSWKSSDSKIAKVSSKGVITPKKTGTVKITVTTADGGHKATCKVTVKRAIKSLKINKTSLTLDKGASYSLKITKKPANATESIKWTTSNKKVATVSKGKIKAVGKGTATITGTTEQGIRVSCKVTVKQPVTSVKISKSTASVYIGSSLKLTATALPSNANTKTITWSSSDKAIATVSKGTVTPKAPGTVKITAKSNNGKTAVCTLTVKQHVESVKLSKAAVTIEKGKTFSLAVSILPSDATDKTYTCSTSDSSVATVSATGVITAKGKGTAKITVKSKENNKSAVCTVTVTQPAGSVSLDKTETSVYIGDSLTLTATVLPSDANNKTVTWSSSDTSIATVSAGKLTLKAPGTVKITAKSHNGKTAVCTLTVKRHVSSVELSQSTLELLKGTSATLTATVLPSDATDKTYTFSSSDEGVATVDNQGKITAVEAGQTVITLTSGENNKTAQCIVTVTEKVSSVEISTTAKTLFVGEGFTLTATVLPETASNKSVIWTSSDETVAAVSSEGEITALKSGITLITVKTLDGDFTAFCSLTVLQKATGITLEESITINKGQQGKITATVLPEDAYNKNVIWSVETEGIITIDEFGLITAENAGKTVVTATSADGGFVAQCLVNVNYPVTGVSLDTQRVEKLYKNETVALVPTVEPVNAPDEYVNRNVIWTSSDESIATVEEGVVTAVGKGEAIITATTVDGGFEASCSVNCCIAVEAVEADSTVYVYKDGTHTLVPTIVPQEASYPDVTMEIVSGEEYFTLEGDVISGTQMGTGVICIRSVDNPEAFINVEVNVILKVEEVRINLTQVTLNKSEICTLTGTVKPSEAFNKNLIFASDNEAVAAVDSQGTVTAVGRGTATITVTSEDNPQAFAECEVTVIQPVEEIVFDSSSYSLGKGKSLTLNPSVLPSNANDTTLIWKSENSSVATVNAGVIKGIGVGETTITATAADNGTVKASVTVTVSQHAESLTLESEATELYIGEETEITVNILPLDTTDKTVVFTSDNEAVAVVDENGIVRATGTDETGISTATITAVSACGCAQGDIEITVKQQAEEITVEEQELVLCKGESKNLGAGVLPASTYDKTVTYISSDEEIITVDSQGNVTAVGAGSAAVRLVSACQKAEKECTVKVIVLPDSVAVASEAIIEKNSSYTLIPSFAPEDTTEKELTFSSADENVATVDENGVITGLSAGETVITVYAAKQGVTAQCKVTVFVNSEAIQLNHNEYTFYIGESFSLEATVLPEDTTNKNVSFSSADESIATVDENGVVTAVEKGETDIIVTAEDTGVAARCTVTVNKHVEEIFFTEGEITAYIGRPVQLSVNVLPSDATNKNIIWSVSDEAVAEITQQGIITGLEEDMTVITAESEDGGFKAKCLLTVKRGIEQVVLSETQVLMSQTSTHRLSFQVIPEDATDKQVIWTSSDEKIATVDSQGVITSKLSAGTTVIRATAVDNSEAYAECTVTVKQPVYAIYFKEDSLFMRKGDSAESTILFDPVDATDKTVTFSSSDETVATVDSEGKITAVASGDAVITATSADSGCKAECRVKVYRELTSLTATDITFINGNRDYAPVTAGPENHDETITYISEDTAIATVDSEGIITAHAPGSVKITATSSISGKKCSFILTVIQPVEGISFAVSSATLEQGHTGSIAYTINPGNASNTRVQFISSDESVAKIIDSTTGAVEALSPGTTIITVITEDGAFSASYELTVI